MKYYSNEDEFLNSVEDRKRKFIDFAKSAGIAIFIVAFALLVGYGFYLANSI